MKISYTKFYEDIRRSVNIFDVVSEYVPLKKRGNKFWGCCPFHNEKTASFTVSTDKDLYYCFGCSTGGDVFNFIMKIENLSFADAARKLAEKYNIPIPEKARTNEERSQLARDQRLYEVNASAGKYFVACLNNKLGQTAREYLSNRQITIDIINRFEIGLALTAWDDTEKALITKGFSSEEICRAGLIVAKDSGGYYDKFRSRVMIPIKNLRGQIVAFGGRILGPGEPKYLNTATTEIFNKRQLLYALNVANDKIRAQKQAIVVEGYMDTISLHSAGFDWTVASLGTAFSQEQAKLLKKIAGEVVFAYDSDEAGQKASFRAISIAREQGLMTKFLDLGIHKDPDDFIRNEGKEAFQKQLDIAIDGTDFQINFIIKNHDVTSLAGKAEIVSNVVSIIKEFQNEILVNEYINKLASQITIDVSVIYAEYNKAYQGTKPITINRNINKKLAALVQAEQHLLQAILHDNAILDSVLTGLGSITFVADSRMNILLKIKEVMQVEGKVSADILWEKLSAEETSELVRALSLETDYTNLTCLVQDCLQKIQIEYLEKCYEKSRSLAVEYERIGDERFLQELTESQRIKNELTKMFQKL